MAGGAVGGEGKEVEFVGPEERERGGWGGVEGRACGMAISTYPWGKGKQERPQRVWILY